MPDKQEIPIAEIPGLPDKWKLIHCSATNPANPDHPMGKWRDADILNLLREIARLTEALRVKEEECERLGAHREWLRIGYRAIADGTLDEAAKHDRYVRYARDTLSGPTKETLDALLAARRTQERGCLQSRLSARGCTE